MKTPATSVDPRYCVPKTGVLSLLTPAADSLAPARSVLTGLRLRRIPIAAFPSSDSLLVERRVPRWDVLTFSDGFLRSASRTFKSKVHTAGMGFVSLRSSDSLQPRLSNFGPSALFSGQQRNYASRSPKKQKTG